MPVGEVSSFVADSYYFAHTRVCRDADHKFRGSNTYRGRNQQVLHRAYPGESSTWSPVVRLPVDSRFHDAQNNHWAVRLCVWHLRSDRFVSCKLRLTILWPITLNNGIVAEHPKIWRIAWNPRKSKQTCTHRSISVRYGRVRLIFSLRSTVGFARLGIQNWSSLGSTSLSSCNQVGRLWSDTDAQ